MTINGGRKLHIPLSFVKHAHNAYRLRQERRLILASSFFNIEWYSLAYPHILHDGIDPLIHFLKFGRKLQLSPSREFYTAHYLQTHQEARESRLNPLIHYLKHGRAIGLEISPAPPSDADRILESGLFDDQWYLANYPDIAAATYPPLLHYLLHGALEGRSPGPDFDASWYLSRYADIAGLNPLLHYIDHGRHEGRDPVQPAISLVPAKPALNEPPGRAARALAVIADKIIYPPQTLVFLPPPFRGQMALDSACNAVRALAEASDPHAILPVLADQDIETLSPTILPVPADIPVLSFSRIDTDLSAAERVELANLLIRQLKPRSVLLAGSKAALEATRHHGRQLADVTKLHAMNIDTDDADYLQQCLPLLVSVYFNSDAAADAMVSRLNIPEAMQPRLITLRQPAASPVVSRRRRISEGPLRILWANRLMPEENVELLFEIAGTAPQFEFHVWGHGSQALELRLAAASQGTPNLQFHGPASNGAGSLPFHEGDVFLHTSRRDDIPGTLLEAAAAGLAIVAFSTSGIGEIVDQRTGWPILEPDNPAPYVAALHAIASDVQGRRKRATAMRKRLRQNHDRQHYREILTSQLLEKRAVIQT